MKLLQFPYYIWVITGMVLMAQITAEYFYLAEPTTFLLTKQSVIHLKIWRLGFWVHVVSSLPVLVLGFFQFFDSLRSRFPVFHRVAGKLYTGVVLGLAAPSGLVLAFYANGGVVARISFTCIALFWFAFTLLSYLQVRKGNVIAHQKNMIRSYALTLSAVALRTYVFILPYMVHMHGREMYILVSFLSWVPNLFVAELIIRFKVKE